MKFERQRYVLVQYKFFNIKNSSIKIDEKKIIRAIWNTLTNLFGECSAYKCGLWIVDHNVDYKYFIIRCSNVTKYYLITSLVFIKKLDTLPIIFHTIKTTGTIKKIKKLLKIYLLKWNSEGKFKCKG